MKSVSILFFFKFSILSILESARPLHPPESIAFATFGSPHVAFVTPKISISAFLAIFTIVSVLCLIFSVSIISRGYSFFICKPPLDN
jgi:hypothetical protein